MVSDKQLKILMVEDNPGDARLIGEMLEEADFIGFELILATRLDEGLKQLIKRDFDVILLDLFLPDGQGMNNVAIFNEQAPHLPIIILTAISDEEFAINAVGDGIQDYLVKGQFDSRLLARSIRYAVERKNTENDLQKAQHELEIRVEERTADLAQINAVLNEEIIKHKRTEADLQESEEKYRELFNNANDMISLNDMEETMPGKFIEVNEVGCKRLGYTRDEILNLTPMDIVAPEKRVKMPKISAELKTKGYCRFEITHMSKDGKKIPVEINNHIFQLKGKKVALAISRDISDRKRAEKEIKSSLKEKEVLLKEIHHRVKNNMQIISSLLDLQKNYTEEDETINVLQESRNRVKSMAMIHENLYQSKDLSNINFSDYIRSLVSDLFYSYGITKGTIIPNINVGRIFLNIETAIPCGLIINELVSNSLKYAFPADRTGEINVDLNPNYNYYELIISDNGVGIPDHVDLEKTDTLGLQLVNNLVKQIDGEVILDRNQGTTFNIRFNELKYKRRL